MNGTSDATAKLSPEEKRALLAQLLQQKQAERRAFPLSSAQTRLWILDRLQPGSPFYNLPTVLRLPGRLDMDALERSLNEIVRRHETLRTTFQMVDGKPAQVVAPSLKLEIPVTDLGSTPAEEREAEAARVVSEECGRPFDLAAGPLVRARLVKLADDDRFFVLVMHHIISDAWSLDVLLRELSTLYNAFSSGHPSPLPELPIQYADFATWQNEWLSGEVLERQLAFWKSHLAGAPELLNLPTDRPRPPAQSNRGAMYTFTLEQRLCDGVNALSRAEGATPFMTYLAAFTALLSRYSGEEDVVVGSPIAGRTRVELENLIGFFVNTLVLRTDLSGDPTFRQLLARVREVTLGAYAHQEMPFERLVEELQPARDLSHNPLFQVMFALQNIGSPDRSSRGSNDNAPQSPLYANGTAKFDIALSLAEADHKAQAALEYNTDLFDEATIVRMVEAFRILLSGIVTDPDRPLSRLPIVGEMERRELAAGWRGPEAERPTTPNVCEAVAAHARREPGATALIHAASEISYGELEARANRFARRLRTLGVRPGAAVGLLAERSIETVVAALGVLKAGAVLVPLDAEGPAVRTARVLGDAGVSLIVAEERLGASLPETEAEVLYLERLGEEGAGESAEAPDAWAADDGLACLLYRSGPSGGPEGLMLTHRALCRTEFAPGVRLTSEDRVAQTSNLSEVAACFDLFGALAAGAGVLIIPSHPPTPPRKLAGLMRDHAATVIITQSSVLERLAREFPWALKTLRLILCDEQPAALGQLQQSLDAQLLERVYGFYGPDEAGGFSSFRALASPPARPGTSPVGQTSAGVRLQLLDAYLEPVPEGVVGEICVAADALSCGYSGQPARTASLFVPDPFSETPGGRLYRTGEKGRRRDGVLEYRGRRDGRVVSRGVYVEPAEVEAAFLRQPGVSEAAVVVCGKAGTRDLELAAFVVAEGADLTPEALLEAVREHLPEAMIPAKLTLLDVMPHTPRGATDRRALADLVGAGQDTNGGAPPYVAPRNEIEERLAGIWAQTFNIQEVGVHDNFFRLGGHSLLATQVVTRVSDAFKIDLPLGRLFSSPTIAELAKVIEQAVQAGEKMKSPPITRMARKAVTLPAEHGRPD